MIKVRELWLGISLLMAAGMAAAAPVKQGGDVKSAETDCAGAAALMEKAMGDAGLFDRFVQTEEDNISGPADSMIEEYLTFHAQARDENGNLPLMPGSALRTHAN